jgi:hypothetical protein
VIVVEDPQFQAATRAGKEHIRLATNFRARPAEISGGCMSCFEVCQFSFKFDICGHDIYRLPLISEP